MPGSPCNAQLVIAQPLPPYDSCLGLWSLLSEMRAHITLVGLARTIHLQVFTVYIRYFRQGNRHTYGHIRCVYTVPANPIYEHACVPLVIISKAVNVWLSRQWMCGYEGSGWAMSA